MGLFFQLDTVLRELSEMRAEIAALQKSVEELRETHPKRDILQEGIEHILTFSGPAAGRIQNEEGKA